MKTKKEILNECIDTIIAEGRCKVGSSCKYIPQKEGQGVGCAVGIFLDRKVKPYIADIEGLSIDSLISIVPLDEIIIDDYKGHELKFWKFLQYLHDNDNFWRKADSSYRELKLSKEGKSYRELFEYAFLNSE